MTTTTIEPTQTKTRNRISEIAQEASCQHEGTQQLLGILEEFTPDSIEEAVKLITEGAPCHLRTEDLPKPGKPVAVGEDGRVELDELATMERIILPDNNLLPVHFLEEGAIVQKAVARIALTQSYAGLPAGSGWGTGFLVSSSLLLTNNHVIPSKGFARKTRAEFNYQNDYLGNALPIDAYSFDPDAVFYTNPTLDFTLIRVQPKCLFRRLASLSRSTESPFDMINGTDGEWAGSYEYTPSPDGPFPPVPDPMSMPMPRLPYHPAAWRPDFFRICRSPGRRWGQLRLPTGTVAYADGQHVNIIQHPQGRRKEVAVQQNRIDNIYTNVVRYTTDTEPGSSGSPVFNNPWDLLAIHHAAGTLSNGQWQNNEGMRMDKIVADMRTFYQGTDTGNGILNELGL